MGLIAGWRCIGRWRGEFGVSETTDSRAERVRVSLPRLLPEVAFASVSHSRHRRIAAHVEDGLDAAEFIDGEEQVFLEISLGDPEGFQNFAAALEGHGFVAVGVAEEMGDDVAEINVGGQPLVFAGGARGVLEPHCGDHVGGEFPAVEEASTDLGVIDAEEILETHVAEISATRVFPG